MPTASARGKGVLGGCLRGAGTRSRKAQGTRSGSWTNDLRRLPELLLRRIPLLHEHLFVRDLILLTGRFSRSRSFATARPWSLYVFCHISEGRFKGFEVPFV